MEGSNKIIFRDMRVSCESVNGFNWTLRNDTTNDGNKAPGFKRIMH
jgi:hypothetical protein